MRSDGQHIGTSGTEWCTEMDRATNVWHDYQVDAKQSTKTLQNNVCNVRNYINVVDGRNKRTEKRKEPCEDTICNCGVGHALNIAVNIEFNLCCDIGHCDGKECKKTNGK